MFFYSIVIVFSPFLAKTRFESRSINMVDVYVGVCGGAVPGILIISIFIYMRRRKKTKKYRGKREQNKFEAQKNDATFVVFVTCWH